MRNFQLNVLKLFAALALMLSFSAANAEKWALIQQNTYNTNSETAVGIQAYYPVNGVLHLSNIVYPNDVYPNYAGDSRLHGQFYLKLGPADAQGNTLFVDTSYTVFGVPTGYSEDNWSCDSTNPNSNCAFTISDPTGLLNGRTTLNVYVIYFDSATGQRRMGGGAAVLNDTNVSAPLNMARFDWKRVTSWMRVVGGPWNGDYSATIGSPSFVYQP